MDYLSILKRYFGYDSFRGIQQDIIESIGNGNDTLGLMPTGGGKSITFQVPALATSGVCIVISPLVALMRDQVVHLKERGIMAACVNSSMSYSEVLQTYDNAVYGGLKFLYVSPERLSTPLFLLKIKQMKVSFITVDEAHCISQWGYDFRPSYLSISKIRECLPDIPILALTATATPLVIEDIQHKLGFKSERSKVFRMSFKRDNLVYVVRHTNDKQAELIHILSSVPGSAIVYARNRQKTKDVAEALKDCGMTATYYHAGLDFSVKEQRQQDWFEGKYRVIVATNAFGMGIDKPDVRVVVHMDSPDSPEAYFQEAGRGGRDGKKAYAVLLYQSSDRRNLMTRISVAFPDKEYVRKVYDHLAYYFQLANESGEGAVYEFNIDDFCYTFKHYHTHVESALAILSRSGYIDFNPDPDTKPRVMFLLARDELYRLREVSQDEEAVITGLMRTYGGLFSDFVFIDISFVARESGLPEELVTTILKSLSRRHILKYIPRRDVPLITYVRDRVLSEKLIIPAEAYELLRDRMVERVSAMVGYLEDDTQCRSRMLLKYFGEESEDCGHCDVCLSGTRTSDDRLEEMQKAVYELFKDSDEVFVSDALSLRYPRKELLALVSRMHEEGVILLEGSKMILKKH